MLSLCKVVIVLENKQMLQALGAFLVNATIYADADWALPASGVSGSQCFYNSKALVGGNGTAWPSSNVSYKYCVIDREGQAGYLTAA